MSFEQVVIVELIGAIKWITICCLLMVVAGLILNRFIDKYTDAKRTVMNQVGGTVKELLDYLIRELDSKKPQE